ncbi:MAG: hypothetical protein DME53_08010 [Verrucomicrobia bacterium]|nr:MAG: hypothetical protein DME53_08010 [Verrucomicrobiota bacterium]
MVRLESGVIRRLFRGRAIPGWLLVLWAITIEILDWWGRIELVKEKLGKVSPDLIQPFLSFVLSPAGRLSIIILGFALILLASFGSKNSTSQVGRLDAERLPEPEPASRPHAERTADREFVRITPDDLMNMCRNHMDIEAQRLIRPYIGKWMEVAGRIHNVRSSSENSAQVTFDRPIGPEIRDFYMYFRDPKWIDRLVVLRRGAELVVAGRITEISAICVTLDDCEIMS